MQASLRKNGQKMYTFKVAFHINYERMVEILTREANIYGPETFEGIGKAAMLKRVRDALRGWGDSMSQEDEDGPEDHMIEVKAAVSEVMADHFPELQPRTPTLPTPVPDSSSP